ncbi:Lrp/AsnC family transcriptional regulator [Streptomyces europaeiscabiei]|uniref:Lrp/AsnC family transcriptional regulator n=1 Tax=Streptomyces TaxID=1883 RepID=UPI000A38B196|nr:MULTISPECIES: Lrp/AsnC family transcriptional regulator [Streptomyces]MDX3585879.1 Lrp/AsnC family transcriptional regulator [Streptomyces europaeiscabiei]MDX3614912.1 Lrp/AsnC family transcriptional regulator [Streptomyces europaeiscabiei]MDX3636014.1 Lrp/AsnC family transcriptional regulator [Streptomyces europaeiscabiei]MDX3654090.1 Lrp/AsnC family transcriptional regulator [Streptomyces europaeiscabiei]WUD31041.1 Lrp/AsnC family transcriptional regulator [Streptomyces europaeiscabiei]
MRNVDALDARILLALDADPRATTIALADRLGLARNTVQARLKRLEEDGRLREPSRRVDPSALGYPLLALITMSISQRVGQPTREAILRIPEVVELLVTTGDSDLLARVVAQDTDDLHRITNLLLEAPGVVRSNTAIVLQEVQPLSVRSLLQRHAGP